MPSKLKQNATEYVRQSVERWNNFEQLNTLNARLTAQKLKNLHSYKRIITPSTTQPGRCGVAKMIILLSLSESNELVVRNRKHWSDEDNAKQQRGYACSEKKGLRLGGVTSRAK